MNERSGVVNIGIEGMMLTFGVHGLDRRRRARPGDGPATPAALFGPRPLSHRRSSPRSLAAACSSRSCTPGCRSPSGRTRSSAGRSSTSLRPWPDRLPEPADHLAELAGSARAASRRSCRPTSSSTLPASAGSSTMFLAPGPHRDLGHLPASCSCRSCCSGRAGASGPGPSASIRRRPRPSASTSSAALPERHPRRRLRGTGRARTSLEAERIVPERHDRGAWLHRPGRDDRRSLDAGRGVRGGAALHVIGGARPGDQFAAPPTATSGTSCARSRASSTARCRTS